MFGALGRLASARPWFVIGAWILFAVVVIATAPGLKSTTDQSDFLPRHYESIQAATLQQKAFPEQTSPGAIVVFDRTDGAPLTDADSARLQGVVAGLQGGLEDIFSGIALQPPSPNRLVQIAVVGLAPDKNPYDSAAIDAVKALRADLRSADLGPHVESGVTGGAAQQADQQDASADSLLIVGLATVLLIVVLLSLIFRSVLITLMPLVVVGIVATPIATGLIGWANKIFDLKVDSSIQEILIVVLFGIGTDYILFFLFRYRERLREGEETRAAVSHAVERAGEAIASAGGAVIVSFMALVLSSLGLFRSLGPALAIAVLVTLMAALTLVPAVAAVLGRALFWPSRKWRKEPEAARFGAVGRSLGQHPARYALVSGGVLVVLAIFALGFKPTFDLGSSGVPADAESSVALDTLEKGLPPGATDPTLVLLDSTEGSPLDAATLAAFGRQISGVSGVASVGEPQVNQGRTTAVYSVILDADPSSDRALDDVKGPIRTAAHDAEPAGTRALVGGTTSVFVDFQAAMNRDYSVVFPVAALIILLILALLLRSLVAPVYLMLSVGLGFAATLGTTVLVFQHLAGESGLIFLLPIYIYLFVVALGTDYNILMIARLREEAREGKSARDATAEAVKHAGPTIAAAGVILAGTFASLMLAGNSLLVSLGFAISFGIFVAAFVMAMFFTPSLTALIGHAAWWPGHGDETQAEHDARIARH